MLTNVCLILEVLRYIFIITIQRPNSELYVKAANISSKNIHIH